jgi:hypothetical protein
MATFKARTTLVCARLAICSALLAPAAQARDASFVAPLTFAAGNQPALVAVGDFNRDGRVDLAVANRVRTMFQF